MLVMAAWFTYTEAVYGPERRAAEEEAAAEAESEEEGETELAESGYRSPVSEVVPAPRPSAQESERAAGPSREFEGDTPYALPLWEGELETPLVRARFSNRGAALVGWRLAEWYDDPSREVNVELLDLPPPLFGALITPFPELGLGDLSEARYEVVQDSSERVVFELRRQGVVIRKSYRLSEEPYSFEVAIQVENGSDRVISPRFEVAWPFAVSDKADFKEASLISAVGDEVERELVASVGSGGFFGSEDDGPTVHRGITWAGVDLRYFAGLLIPRGGIGVDASFVPITRERSAATTFSSPAVEIVPGASLERRFAGFIGPKQPALLEGREDRLDLAISRGYSWFAPLTSFFEWALHAVHAVVPNYGLAIIVLTILVRLATWPIMARQMKSAEKMRDLMPRIKEIQEKYKDDRQKQSEETFALYRETGVNPLGGCLPLFLQMPVFIGLFYALQSSIDLRHAPFFLWIDDLSAPATLFTIPGLDFPVRLMPIFMGASMFAQQKMMPQTGMDPAQAKMMLFMMPGMMLVISYSFPSGLVLYWLVSNLLGIAHQLWVRRTMHANDPE